MTKEQNDRLFEIFYRSRFQEQVALDLMRSANRWNKILLWFLLISVAASLLTGSISFLNTADLRPVWALVSISATIASIAGVAKRPNEELFLHFDTARAFDALSAEVENFTKFAVHANGTDNIDASANDLHRQYTELLTKTGVTHRDYGNKNSSAITKRLKETLAVEKMVK